ncbi:hypothetical protein AB0L54_34160 [Streptomyces sp. NPDC052196]|uniref:DUF6907 domain-containing protein n=1 Tax=Streptomyces sp. NPDC052196 TaxID=3156691 RepID=UPI0034454E25
MSRSILVMSAQRGEDCAGYPARLPRAARIGRNNRSVIILFMDAEEWKRQVTGSHCPRWCVAKHDEDPASDTILHVSDEAAFELPPLPGGTRYTLAIATSAHEALQEQGRRTALHIEMRDQDGLNELRDYVPISSRAEADQVAADLEAAAAQLRAWRERLPD